MGVQCLDSTAWSVETNPNSVMLLSLESKHFEKKKKENAQQYRNNTTEESAFALELSVHLSLTIFDRSLGMMHHTIVT